MSTKTESQDLDLPPGYEGMEPPQIDGHAEAMSGHFDFDQWIADNHLDAIKHDLIKHGLTSGSTLSAGTHSAEFTNLLSDGSFSATKGYLIPQLINACKLVAKFTITASSEGPVAMGQEEAMREQSAELYTKENSSVRARLIKFYEEHNPAELDDEQAIDELLREYQGREQLLFCELETKYILSGPKYDEELNAHYKDFETNVHYKEFDPTVHIKGFADFNQPRAQRQESEPAPQNVDSCCVIL